jgi:hypothetical protein
MRAAVTSTWCSPSKRMAEMRHAEKRPCVKHSHGGCFLVAFVVQAVEPDQGGPIRPTRAISSRIDNEKTHFQAMETARIVDAGWAPR